MITIEYTNDMHTYTKGMGLDSSTLIFPDIMDILDTEIAVMQECIARNLDVYYLVASENIIHRVKLAIKRGELSVNDIKLMYKGQQLTIDSTGTIDIWPGGFCDCIHNMLVESLDW